MGLFSTMKEPIFLKESSNAELQLEKLTELVEATINLSLSWRVILSDHL